MTSPLAAAHDLDAFRAAIRDWLPGAIPADWKGRIRRESEEGYLAVQREWYQAQTEAGLATAHWPRDWGGADLSLAAQVVLYEEMARADAPNTDLFTVSLYHMPATLFAYGTPEQRARYLEGVRTGGDIWCQGFSEPGAGSDLASLRTRAERRGDVYVVNGQKIWSSYGVFADYCLLLARTNQEAARKHDGISYFILDMNSPGLTVKPIRQITGEAEFAEIFFDDVEIPVENLIGAENEGWRIAQSTLTAERGLLIFENSERLVHAVRRDAARYRDLFAGNPAKAAAFASFYPRARALKHLVSELLTQLERDPHGGGEIATYIKLYWATLLQDYNGFTARLDGLDALIEAEPLRCAGQTPDDTLYAFLKSYSWTVAGGSNEIMRNVIAERLLGLPR
ncbi:acyl-CoA dehydrogenase family protein [uncultured Sphingomonas sp.]|uniref:acyl-CoA dehydrogenase family protein n=1 Tax=uncultured Sphingomonas sp. TaxID=158754 RepID=UPI0025D81CDB|nr:acyl-CoA dehydrogenase family protein [uncultured Sphingomonas sp.]